MPVVVFGVSHHHATTDDLARFSDAAAAVLPDVLAHEAVAGGILLATCNRCEFYLDVAAFHPSVDAIGSALRRADAGPAADVAEVFVGQGAAEHLFAVAAGLDSMVVGEAEIAGQVRRALARHEASATAVLRRLFQMALTTSKAVASNTALEASGRSLVAVGLDLVASRRALDPARPVVVIGTGDYAGVVVATLVRRGLTNLACYSESGRARAFAATHPVRALEAGSLPGALADAGLVVCCSGTGNAPLTHELLRERPADAGPLAILDLSLGRDLAGRGELAGVDAVDLDAIGAHAGVDQLAAEERARQIVAQAVDTYLHVELGRSADPAVTAMRAHISRIIETEIADAARREKPEVAEAVRRSLHRVSGALLHTPSVRAAAMARTGDLDDYRHALHTLFGIEVEAS